MQQQTATPRSIMAELWGAASDGVVEAIQAATAPESLLAIAAAIIITHWFKMYLEAFHVNRIKAKLGDRIKMGWRFITMTASIVAGAISGAFWAWWDLLPVDAIPILAITTPLAWLVLIALPLPALRKRLLTPTDRL